MSGISCSTSLSASLHPAFDKNVDITMCVTALGIVTHTQTPRYTNTTPVQSGQHDKGGRAVASCSEPTPGRRFPRPAACPAARLSERGACSLTAEREEGSFGVRKSQGEEGGGGAH